MEEESLRVKSAALVNGTCLLVQSLLTELVRGILNLCITLKEIIWIIFRRIKNFPGKHEKKKKDLKTKKTFKERIQQVWPALHMCGPREMRIATEFIAKGMGLMAGYEGRQARFNVYHLRGGSAGSVRVEVWSECGPIPIERKLQREKLEIIFVPPRPGLYTIILTSLGRPIPGSPFTVKVDEACYAPPFISPFRQSSPIINPTKTAVNIVDFGDEEMLVKEDGTLVSINKPKQSVTPIQKFDNKEVTLNENMGIDFIATNEEKIQPLLLESTRSPFLKPKFRNDMKQSQDKSTEFKMANYVTRQESIESLKCSKNIKKLITKFESTNNELDKVSVKKLSKNWTNEELRFQYSQSGLNNLFQKSSNNQPPSTSENSISDGRHLFDIQESSEEIQKSAKVTRSHSLNSYIGQIATLLKPGLRNRKKTPMMDDIPKYSEFYGTKVYRSSSLYDKTRNLRACGIESLNDPLSQHFKKTCNTPFPPYNKSTHPWSSNTTIVDPISSIPVLERMSYRSQLQSPTKLALNSLPGSVLRQGDTVPSLRLPNEVSSSRLNSPFNITDALNRHSAMTRTVNEELRTTLNSSEPSKNIGTLGAIYSPSKTLPVHQLSSVLEVPDDREMSNSPPNQVERMPITPDLFADEFDVFAASRSAVLDDEKDDPWRLHEETLSQCPTINVNIQNSFDSASSRDEGLIEDVTEPNMSFDFDLSSLDSNHSSLENDTTSPILNDDQFQASSERRPSIKTFFEDDFSHSDDVSMTSHIKDNHSNLRREWKLTNSIVTNNDLPPLPKDTKCNYGPNSKSAISLPAFAACESNINADQIPAEQCTSFMSLDLSNQTASFHGLNTQNEQLNNLKTSITRKSRSSLSLDEKKLTFCRFNRFCSNIGLKKGSRGSFQVNHRNQSIKKSDNEKSLRFIFCKNKSMKKQKESMQKQLNVQSKSSNYSSYHSVKSQENINFVGRMKDYWNNINKGKPERNKDAKLNSVTPKIVAKNRDRFEKMGKLLDKFTNTSENKKDKDTEFGNTSKNDKIEISSNKNIPKTSEEDSKPWRLSDFIDKTPRSPFAKRRESFQELNTIGKSNSELDSFYQCSNFSRNSEIRKSKNNIILSGDPKRYSSHSEISKIGKFDKLINKDALLASLRSFDTESAYSKTLQDQSDKSSGGYDVQYPHVPVKHKKDYRPRSPFSCKGIPLKLFRNDKVN